MGKIKSIREMREEKQDKSTNINEYRRAKDQQFYQSKLWKKTREAYRMKMRKQHEQIIMDFYENNPKHNKPIHLQEFFDCEQNYPLSEQSLKEGKIRVANTLDHITPIADGGSKTDFTNLQWLTHSEHSSKTAQENNTKIFY